MQGNATVHYRQQYVRCGKQGCSRCTGGQGHGPYWYAVWREKDRVRTRYIGKTLPPGATGALVDEVAPPDPAVPALAPEDGTAGSRSVPHKAGMVGSIEGHPTSGRGTVRAAEHTPLPKRAVIQGRQPLRIWTLGRFQVERGGIPVPPTAWRRQAAMVLLKLLLLAERHRLPREHISSYLWPDADAATGRGNLSGALHALRRALEPDLTSGARSQYLRQEGPSLVLHLDEHDWVDYHAFEALLAEAGSAGDPLPQLEAAVALYGGDLLPEEQDIWCVAAREALRLRWHGVLLALAEAQAARHHLDRALSTLTRLLAADRTNEEAARRLMGMLARQGRRAEAMQIFNRLAAALEDDLGTTPAPETESLFLALQVGTAPRRRTSPASRPFPSTDEVGDAHGRGRPPLIGRGPELTRIRGALEVARTGRHSALLLAGDAGIGKTYLAGEAAAMATILGYVVLSGYAGEGEVDLPYAAVAEALRCYTRTRPLAALRRDLVGAEALVELLPELAQPPLSLPYPSPLEHEGAARLRLWNAALALLTSATALNPILLLLEDMHWADSASLGLITFLIRRGKGLRWILLGTLRPEQEAIEHPLQRLIREGRRAGTLELLELEGLSRDDVGKMARATGGTPLTEMEVTALHEQCAGNPLFIREVLNLIVSRAGTSTAPGTAGTTISGTQALPHTIRQAFLQRIDRQSGECKALLQAAATIGGRFPTDLLAQTLGQEPCTFEHALDEAVASGLLREEPLAGALSIPHPLLQRTLYEEIAPSVRGRLHGRIATMLLERAVGRADPDPALLAHHFGGAHEPIAAARWLERAADLAGEIHGHAEVIAQYEQALAAVDGCQAELLSGAEWGAWRSRLHEKLGDRLILTQGFGEAGECYRRAIACIPFATSADDDRGPIIAAERIRFAGLQRKEGVALERAGSHADALAAFAAAGAAGTDQATGESTLPAPMLAEIEIGRGMAYRGAGRPAEAEAAVRRALVLLEGVEASATLSRALSLRGQLAHERSEEDVAEQSYLRSLEIRERDGDQQGAAGCWYSLGMLAYDRGALAEAERCFERSLAIRERIGDAWGSAFGWQKLGQIAQARANYAWAEECYRTSLRIGERIGNQPGIADASFNLGQVALARAEYAEAERCFQRSLTIQELIGDEAGVAASIGDIAEVARDRGELSLAESLARQSIAIHDRLHDRLGIATSLLNLGLIAAERGNQAEALRNSRQARRLAHQIAAHRTECRAALAQAVSAIQMGRHRLAAALLRRGTTLNALDGSTRTAALIHLLQGESALLQDRPDQASEAARAAFRCAAGQFRREEASAQRLLGRCEATVGRYGEAERLLLAAVATYQEIGAGIEVARTQIALASCIRAGGAGRGVMEEAKRLATGARELLRAAGAADTSTSPAR